MNKLYKNDSMILGVRLAKVNLEQALKKIELFLNSDKKHSIFTPNPEICLNASRNPEYTKILNRASINIADGFGLKIGGAILGQKIPNRITGVDLTWEILKLAAKNSHKVMLLGGGNGIAKKAAQQIKTKFPNIQLVGAGEGLKIKYQNNKIAYNSEQNQKVVNFINTAQPDILFVAFGAPKQEFWISQNIYKLKSVKLMLGVGGTLDFISGKIKRAPTWIRQIGMEWLFRFIQEPKRLTRIINALIVFPLTCLRWRFGWKFKYRKNIVNIIYNHKKQILLIYNPRFNYWTLPQGGVEEKDLIQAGQREIFEELGLKKDKIEFMKFAPAEYTYDWPIWSKLLKPYKGQKQKFALWKFIGTEKDFDFKKSDEVSQIKWVNKENLLKTIAPVRRDSVKTIFRYL